MRFLTCEPNLKGLDNYVDVADKFYAEPAAWIRSHLPVHPKSALPTHVILFDSLVDKIAAFLKGFRKVYEFEHTQVNWDSLNSINKIVFCNIYYLTVPIRTCRQERADLRAHNRGATICGMNMNVMTEYVYSFN